MDGFSSRFALVLVGFGVIFLGNLNILNTLNLLMGDIYRLRTVHVERVWLLLHIWSQISMFRRSVCKLTVYLCVARKQSDKLTLWVSFKQKRQISPILLGCFRQPRYTTGSTTSPFWSELARVAKSFLR